MQVKELAQAVEAAAPAAKEAARRAALEAQLVSSAGPLRRSGRAATAVTTQRLLTVSFCISRCAVCRLYRLLVADTLSFCCRSIPVTKVPQRQTAKLRARKSDRGAKTRRLPWRLRHTILQVLFVYIQDSSCHELFSREAWPLLTKLAGSSWGIVTWALLVGLLSTVVHGCR